MGGGQKNEKHEAFFGLQLLGLVLCRIRSGRGSGGIRFLKAGPDSGGISFGGAGDTHIDSLKSL